MSAKAEVVLGQLKQLPKADQQEILRRLRSELPESGTSMQKPFPTVKLGGEPITSEQVAEVLDDE